MATFTGGSGPDVLQGGDDNDTLDGGAANDSLHGGNGNDTLDGGAGDDALHGGSGDDVLDGGTGNDEVTGGSGADTIKFAAGDGMDTVYTFDDTDIVQISGYASAQSISQVGNDIVVVFSDDDRITFVNTTLAAVQAALVFLGDNVINGTPEPDTLYGTSGVDIINGLESNDGLYGGGGDDKLYGNAGADFFDGGQGADRMYGGTGGDTYTVNQPGDEVHEIAGEGDDWVKTSIDYTLAPGVSVETLSTTNAAATTPLSLTGNEVNQSIYGNAGNNVIDGAGGNDYLIGGAGSDTLIGGTGDDVFRVNDPTDVVIEAAGEGDDLIRASTSYTLSAGSSVETMTTRNASGTAAINFTGNELNQSIYGNNGANILDGGAGNDYLIGLAGNDTLIGGAGEDALAGKSGNDTFVFNAPSDSAPGAADRILDFSSGDLIDLGAIDADSGLASDQAFTFVGSNAFSNTAGELRAFESGGKWTVQGDIDGDGIADFAIIVTSAAALTAGDFVF